MSRRCELTGVGVQSGHKVSHSQRKTKRRFKPNTRDISFTSGLTGQEYRFKITVGCLRTVEKLGGFDDFMIKVGENNLSDKARAVRKEILQKRKIVEA